MPKVDTILDNFKFKGSVVQLITSKWRHCLLWALNLSNLIQKISIL